MMMGRWQGGGREGLGFYGWHHHAAHGARRLLMMGRWLAGRHAEHWGAGAGDE